MDSHITDVTVSSHTHCPSPTESCPGPPLQAVPGHGTRYTSQMNQTLGVKRARAQYGLPSVSTPLHTNKECKTYITFSRLFFVAHLLMPCRSNIVLAKIIRACFVCSSPRAIIIRAGEVIPVSTEFTPESERQRLQFLVRKNLSQLLFSEHSCQILAELTSPPVETQAMLSFVSLTPPALFASVIDYGIVFPIPWACQSFFLFLFSYQRPTCSPTY